MSIDSSFYNEEIKNIKRIKFNIFGNKEVKCYSAVKDDPFGINLSDSYDNYEPKKGGLVDLRLGTCDIYLKCVTCGLNSLECPGHFGHTDLAEPVFHFGFITHVTSVLKCICLKCSNILIERTPSNIDKLKSLNSKNRFKEIKEMCKNISYCYHCGTPVPKIKKEVKEQSASIRILLEKEIGNVVVNQSTGESTEQKKVLKESLLPRDCHNILRNISDTDCYILGFKPNESRPEDMIITRFPIPPVSIRPTAKIDFMSSATMEDSITLKISDIIVSNNRVRNQLNKDSNLSNNFDTHTLLQYHMATYFDNESTSLPKSEFKTGNKPTKSISDRIKGKHGRVRGNLMGKRVDFSARSVITSDPNISIDQVGVPLKIAMDLTIPEEVTPQNIEKLTKLVLNGRDIYPGANFVFKKNVINNKKIIQRIDLKYRKKNIRLSFGDTVERHIVNDDYVLFNRQPTLHKPSMMGHRIHVLKRDDCNTLRMNVCVTKPYNADFDGDEMNIHLGQSIQAKNELQRIANVKLQIIGSKDSNPIIGCVQDTLVGAYLLTNFQNTISYNDAVKILCTTNAKNLDKLVKGKSITGQELFSYIIPDKINTIKKKGDNIFFQIKNGNLVKGTLEKSQLSTKKNSIIHYVWDKYGPTETSDFIDNSQHLILEYLLLKGMTIGFKDTIVSKETDDIIKELIRNKVLSSHYQLTQVENDDNKLSAELTEELMKAELNSISSDTGRIILDSVPADNNFSIFIKSGSKGSPINVAQISGCLGQVAVGGTRIKKKVLNRTIPYFHQNDDTPAARGFVASNFIDGLKGHEFFFHHMGGREGLIDTAIKTADTGYIQRKLIKALEDAKVLYDGTVRTSNNIIMQYTYGENGINQTTQTELKINLINLNDKSISDEYTFNKDETKKLKSAFKNFDVNTFNQNIIKKVSKYRNDLRKIYFRSTLNYRVITDSFKLPINLQRLLQEYSINTSSKIDLSPDYILEKIENIINNYDNRLIVCLKEDSKLLKKDDKQIKYLLKIALYEYLNPKKCIFENNLDKSTFDKLLEEINNSLLKAIVEPGEMVGIIAAQSVGEPTSQMTLNTKHFAGVASKGTANMGVSRIKEILHYSKNIKTPQMNIYFDSKYNKNKNDVSIISSYLKHLTIKELLDSAEIYFDYNGNDHLSKMIKDDNTKNPFYISSKKEQLENLPILFRFKINLEALMDKETTLLDIKTKFITYWYKNLSNIKLLKKSEKDIIGKVLNLAILDNNEDIIHIKFNMTEYSFSLLTKFLNFILNNITLKGLDNVNDIDIIHERQVDIGDDGSIVVDKEYTVITNGINVSDLKFVKGIDHSRTKYNDTHTVYSKYGIEAARQILINQLLLTYNAGGSDVNHTHMSLLVDTMTFNGFIISIDRHGLNKIDSDPMSRASFEKTMEHFVNAALFNEVDSLQSVSSRVIVGRTINGGTSSFNISVDLDKIKNTEYIENESKGRTNYINIIKDPLFDDIINNDLTDMDFFMPK